MSETTVAAIIFTENKNGKQILLTRRNIDPFKGYWCLPGGHIEKDESPREAVTREIREEVGLDFNARFIGYFDEIIPKLKINVVVAVFEGRSTGKLIIQDSEVTEAKWVSLEEACSFSLAFTHYEILDVYATRQLDNETKSGILDEYKVLREEAGQRIQARDQLLTFTLAIAGTFIGLAVQFPTIDPALLLIYPLLVTFLTIAWTHHDIRISQLGKYVGQKIEPVFEGMGWQGHLITEYGKSENRFLRNLTELSAGGIFIGSELITMVIAGIKAGFVFTPIDMGLLVLDIVGITFTIYLVRIRRASSRSKKPSYALFPSQKEKI